MEKHNEAEASCWLEGQRRGQAFSSGASSHTLSVLLATTKVIQSILGSSGNTGKIGIATRLQVQKFLLDLHFEMHLAATLKTSSHI